MPPTFAEILEASTERCRRMDAPLAERLQAFADDVRALSPEFAGIVERMVERLRRSGTGKSAPAIGEPMPAFLLPDENGRLRSLEDILQKGPLVIAFHRGHWCPYCRINASALTAIHEEAQRLGGQLVAITPELQNFSAKLKSDAGAPYPILTDLDNAYALELKLAIWVGEEKKQAMQAAGWDISEYHGNNAWMLPIPATFVVGTDGIVKACFADPDYRRRMALDDMLSALKAA
jgi:peroxiredoxin